MSLGNLKGMHTRVRLPRGFYQDVTRAGPVSSHSSGLFRPGLSEPPVRSR